jgi:hypothetical protein
MSRAITSCCQELLLFLLTPSLKSLLLLLPAEEIYGLRLKALQPLPDVALLKPEPKIYTEDGGINANKVTKDGRATLTKMVVKEEGKLVVEKSHKEDPEVTAARALRLETFSEAAKKSGVYLGPDLSLADISLNINKEEEEVLQVLEISEIKGLPASTDEITITGLMKIALVRHKTQEFGVGGLSETSARLLFSVSKGFGEISADEKFAIERPEMTGCFARCCTPARLSCLCPCYVSGDFRYDYKMRKEFTNVLCYLPINNNVVDAMAYQEAVMDYSAEARGKAAGFMDGVCCNPCWSWSCCISCCSCCCNIHCCKVDIVGHTDNFKVNETFLIGGDDNKGLNAIATQEVESVEWKVKKSGTDDVYIVIQYRSPLNNRMRVCQMKLQSDENAFFNASRFITAIGANRGKTFDHEAIHVKAVATSRVT